MPVAKTVNELPAIAPCLNRAFLMTWITTVEKCPSPHVTGTRFGYPCHFEMWVSAIAQ
jgi:hypothetical protein